MDPFTAANTLATLVQLVGMFKQEQKDAEEVDHQKFIEWLEYHRHEELKHLICNTSALQTELVNLLRQDTATILSRLSEMNNTLASLSTQIAGFSGLARALNPYAELSEQAVYILRQLVQSKAKNLVYADYGECVVLQPDNGEPFEYTDAQFLSDDIESLGRFGLVAPRNTGGHTELYGITRGGAKYIQLLDNPRSTINPQPAT
jgi:hypothetical protein